MLHLYSTRLTLQPRYMPVSCGINTIVSRYNKYRFLNVFLKKNDNNFLLFLSFEKITYMRTLGMLSCNRKKIKVLMFYSYVRYVFFFWYNTSTVDVVFFKKLNLCFLKYFSCICTLIQSLSAGKIVYVYLYRYNTVVYLPKKKRSIKKWRLKRLSAKTLDGYLYI